MKGIIIKPTTKEKPITHRYGRLLAFYCDKCGSHLSSCYENDVKNGGGVAKDFHYCMKCGNAVDFGEYYYQEKGMKDNNYLDEEIEFKE